METKDSLWSVSVDFAIKPASPSQGFILLLNFPISCILFHVKTNERVSYSMNSLNQQVVNNGKDSVEIISDDWELSKQYGEAVKRSVKILGFVCRAFDFKSKKLIHAVSDSLVIPILNTVFSFGHCALKKRYTTERIKWKATEVILSQIEKQIL